jgi:hypothetical protein
MMWQPINTAPRNGKKFLAYCENGTMRVDWIDEAQANIYGQFWHEHLNNRYTHWMPLPLPPPPAKAGQT